MNNNNNKKQLNIPNDWRKIKLGEILSVGSGKDYKHLEKGAIPVFGTGGYMLSVNKALYSGETVFIGRKGTIDKPFYFNGDFWTVDTLFYTHQFKNTSAKYINKIFKKINWKLYNEASGVPSLSKSTIEKIIVTLPPLQEQNRIVSVLETWDKSIEKLEQKINIKKNIKKGLIQNLLTGKKRLSGFKDKWEVSSLEKMVDIIKNGVPKFTGLKKYYSTSAVLNNKKIDLVSYEDRQSRANMYPSINDVAIAKMKGTNRCFIMSENFLGSIFSTGFCFLKTKKDIDYSFIYYLVSDDKFQYFKDLYSASGIMGGIGNKELLSIEIKIPTDIKEQKAIADILTKSDNEIVLLNKKLELLKNQRKYLLNKLITGEIRTPENLKVNLK